jgi:hypothetical protein
MTLLIYLICYHLTLLYLKANWFIYLFCLMSFIHSLIHLEQARITIVETGVYSLDE